MKKQFRLNTTGFFFRWLKFTLIFVKENLLLQKLQKYFRKMELNLLKWKSK